MKRLFVCVLCLALGLGFASCQKREKLTESDYLPEPNGETGESLIPSVSEKADDEMDITGADVEEEEKDFVSYKIEGSEFKIDVPNSWNAVDLAEPMGAMLFRSSNPKDSAIISYCVGEEKAQKEKDFESVFDALKQDLEIHDYKITKSKDNGLYRILLSYNQVLEDGEYNFSYVLYQQTKEGLIEISFSLSEQIPHEIDDMLESVLAYGEGEAVPMPTEE